MSMNISFFSACELNLLNLVFVSDIFSNYVLDISEGIHDLGPVRWELRCFNLILYFQ